MRAVVVTLDVLVHLPPGLFDGLPLRAPGTALLELPEPALDERLGLGVPVAAASVSDVPGGQMLSEVPRGELRAVVGPERQLPGSHTASEHCVLYNRDGLVVSTPKLQGPAR